VPLHSLRHRLASYLLDPHAAWRTRAANVLRASRAVRKPGVWDDWMEQPTVTNCCSSRTWMRKEWRKG
jgi:hypothetical protein